jgi:hypothetical protein
MLARYFVFVAVGVLGLAGLAVMLLDVLSCAFSLPLPKWVNGGSRDEYLNRPLWWWVERVVFVTIATGLTVGGAVALRLLH